MPRSCTVCAHEHLAKIDAALLSETPLRDIARQWKVSKDAAARHRDRLPATMVKAQEQEDVRHAIDVVAQLKVINAEPPKVLDCTSDEFKG